MQDDGHKPSTWNEGCDELPEDGPQVSYTGYNCGNCDLNPNPVDCDPSFITKTTPVNFGVCNPVTAGGNDAQKEAWAQKKKEGAFPLPFTTGAECCKGSCSGHGTYRFGGMVVVRVGDGVDSGSLLGLGPVAS